MFTLEAKYIKCYVRKHFLQVNKIIRLFYVNVENVFESTRDLWRSPRVQPSLALRHKVASYPDARSSGFESDWSDFGSALGINAKHSHGPLRDTHWSLVEVAFFAWDAKERGRPQGTFRGERFSHRNVHGGEGWGVTVVFAGYSWRYEFNKKFGLG